MKVVIFRDCSFVYCGKTDARDKYTSSLHRKNIMSSDLREMTGRLKIDAQFWKFAEYPV